MANRVASRRGSSEWNSTARVMRSWPNVAVSEVMGLKWQSLQALAKAPTSPEPSPATRCTRSAGSSPSRARSSPGDFVTTETGTGLVHMAPDHGEDDFLLCKAHGIDPVFAVEGDGKYRADWAWLGGQGS